MSRILVLTVFLTRDLFRVLLGAVPPVLTLGLFQATFYYGGSVDYFAAVAGADLALIALVTILLLVGRANRAATYPLLARLPRRVELLAALFAAALATTLAMGVLLVALILHFHKADVSPLQMLVILPRWLALCAFAIALGLNLGKLASRGRSHLVTAGAIAAIVTANGLQAWVLQNDNWVARSAGAIASPLVETMSEPVATFPTAPVLAILACTALLFALAAALFEHKDLLWAE